MAHTRAPLPGGSGDVSSSGDLFTCSEPELVQAPGTVVSAKTMRSSCLGRRKRQTSKQETSSCSVVPRPRKNLMDVRREVPGGVGSTQA